MTEKEPVSKQAIRAFVAYRLVSRGYFHLSVLFVFLLQAGHSVISVACVLAAYGLALAAFTPVTSVVVGKLGAGRALVLGEVLKATGLLVLAIGVRSLPVAIAAQVINAAGFAIAASADPGVLSGIADPATARSLQARTQSLMFLALLVCGVAGGALYLAGHRWPVLAAAASALAAAALAARLARLAHASAGAVGRPAAASGARTVAPDEIRWMTYYVLTRGFMLGVFIGMLPFLIFSMLHSSVPVLALYLAAYSLAAFVTARYAGKLLEMWTATVFAAVTAVLLLGALVAFALSSSVPVVVVALVLLGAASGCVRPVTMTQLAAVSGQFRGSTVPGWLISRMEGLFGVCNSLVVLCGGILISRWSFTGAMLVLCACYVVVQALAGLYALRRAAASVVRQDGQVLEGSPEVTTTT